MIVAGWNNGKPDNRTGGGYGIRVRGEDRDNYFHETWTSVIVQLDNGEVVDAGLLPSFWGKTRALWGKEIGKWMLERGFAPWPKGNPPKFRFERIGDRRYRLTRL